jgi:hypothetical protein
VGDRFEDVGAGSVGARERDEHAARVVLLAPAQLERDEWRKKLGLAVE